MLIMAKIYARKTAMEIGIAKMLKQNTLCLKREGPFLLICLGSIGAIGTAILEAKETVKALLLIIQSNQDITTRICTKYTKYTSAFMKRTLKFLY